MSSLWPSYLSFIVFMTGAIVFSIISVWLGYFANPTQNVAPLAFASFISALMASIIGESIAKKNGDRYDKYGR